MNDSASPSDFPDALPAHAVLRDGAFLLEEPIGQGGFGITYRVLDNSLQRPAAIKEFFPRGAVRDAQTLEVLPLSSSEFQNAKEQFLIEARALAQFNHPHIVDVYSIFEESQTAYMVMEFVRGSTLTQYVEAQGALSEADALKIIEQIGSALGEVHRLGLLHLDIKPDNIMIEEASGRAVLLDFGLTKKIENASSYGTMRLDAWSRFGTPGFAAIEQYSESGQTGTWTDIYGLAATLYFLLVGKAPPEAATRATGANLPDLRVLKPETSRAVADAIERALNLSPDARPQLADEFLDLLNENKTDFDSASAADSNSDSSIRDAASVPVQVLPRDAPSTPVNVPPTQTPEFDDAFSDVFGARSPNRPGPLRRRSGRTNTFDPRNPFGHASGDPNDNARLPITFLPFGFGCSGMGCSMGCFIFIMLFLMFIASILDSAATIFIF